MYTAFFCHVYRELGYFFIYHSYSRDTILAHVQKRKTDDKIKCNTL